MTAAADMTSLWAVARPIFIVGAARSGTHLLASLLRKNLPGMPYVGEVNDLWLARRPDLGHDQIAPDMLTERDLQTLAAALLDQVGGATVWLDKTAANVLRPALICRLFPQARIVHIIRDGRDVVLSVRRKAGGDLRKITRDGGKDRLAAPSGIGRLHGAIRHKLQRPPSPAVLWRSLPRYASASLAILGLRHQRYWGPRIPGYRDLMKRADPLEVYARQWQHCVHTMRDFAAANASFQYLEIRFEDLVADPRSVLGQVLVFLGHEAGASLTLVDLRPAPANGWQAQLTGRETALIGRLLDADLVQLGYRPTITATDTTGSGTDSHRESTP